VTSVDMSVVARLEDKAIDIKKLLFDYTNNIGNSHLGGALSAADIVVAMYYHLLKFDPKNPTWPERDRFVISKGHLACLMHNVFADLGILKREDLFKEYNAVNGRFGQHPNRKFIPGIEASTGSLGHGLSLAVGFALAGRKQKADWRVYCLTGDGELNEGSNWEAIMMAAKYQLGNLVAIVDLNHLQIGGQTSTVMPMEPMDDKWKAFGWDTIRIDGHDMAKIVETFESLPPSDSQTPRKPIVVIADTVKGHGIPFMENNAAWHIGGLDEEKLEECCTYVEAGRKQRA